MDISEYAINSSPVKEHLVKADVTIEEDWESVKEFAGVDSFDVVFTEHLLSHFNDETVKDINDLCMVHGDSVVHRVFSSNTDSYNSNSVSYWIDYIGSFENIYWVDTDNEEDGLVG